MSGSPTPAPSIQPGHIVTHASTGDLEWTVTGVTGSTVRVASRVLSRRQEREFPLAQLQVVDSMADRRELNRPRFERTFNGDDDDPPVSETASDEAESSRIGQEIRNEDDGRPLLLQLLDLVDFSDSCLRQYKNEIEPRIPWPETAKRLRRELRNHGRLIKRNPSEYLRIRTHRFDISLRRRPTETDRLQVTQLQIHKYRATATQQHSLRAAS